MYQDTMLPQILGLGNILIDPLLFKLLIEVEIINNESEMILTGA